PGIRTRTVGTAAELGEAMREESAAADVVVMAAAVADYRPAQVSERKITKESGTAPVIELIENEDIVAGLVRMRAEGSGPAGQSIVGFAAETPSDAGELLDRARRKRERKGVDLLAVSEVGWDRGFERSENTVHVIGASGDVVAEATGSKREVAAAIWDAVLEVRAGE